MQIIFHPVLQENLLNEKYHEAIKSAVEMYLLTAYLRQWQIRSNLSPKCKKAVIVAGIDFGITRREACQDVLSWTAEQQGVRPEFFAADKIDGFHPKVLLWKDGNGVCNIIIGSSNLTDAAFNTNYEANAVLKITEDQFKEAVAWVQEIIGKSTKVDQRWIDNYMEAVLPERNRPRPAPQPPLDVNGVDPTMQQWLDTLVLPQPLSWRHSLARRREKIEAWQEIDKDIRQLIAGCAGGEINDDDFYHHLTEIWGTHRSRFMGRGYERSARNSDFRAFSRNLNKVLQLAQNEPVEQLDNAVTECIDNLAQDRVPTRGALLSEFLCHFRTDLYPLIDKPIKVWLEKTKYPTPRGAGLTEGGKYIHRAQALRAALRLAGPDYPARNLAELDTLIERYARQQDWL